MFKPDLKDTGWEVAPEVVFSISGEKYSESNFDRTFYEVERKDGTLVTLSKINTSMTKSEKKLATILNDSLMDVLWDSVTISELEKHFAEALDSSFFGTVGFRLELSEDCIFGWVHYKEDKKIYTFRFKIGTKGEFSKC